VLISRSISGVKLQDLKEAMVNGELYNFARGIAGTQNLFCFNETTRRYIPEGYHLYTRRPQNLKSHIKFSYLSFRNTNTSSVLDGMQIYFAFGNINK
jgi:hypothetical protein